MFYVYVLYLLSVTKPDLHHCQIIFEKLKKIYFTAKSKFFC